MKRRAALLIIAAFMLGTPDVFAVIVNDIAPPWRGNANSTYQAWEFADDDNPAPPEIDNNPYGDPLATMIGGIITMGWLPEESGHYGVWKLDDYTVLAISNTGNNEPDTYKDVYLQMTYNSPGGPYAWLRYDAGSGLSPLIAPTSTEDAGGGYSYSVWEFRIEPNPLAETIYIAPYSCELYVDEIIVDTICVPEPATICLLAFGTLGLLRKPR